MRSHRQPATTLSERNLGARPEISECGLVPTRSKCRFRIWGSRAVSIVGRTKIHVLPKGGAHMQSHRQPATTLPERNLGAGPKISECDPLPTGSKCRFRIGGYDNRCTSTHAPRQNFGTGTEFYTTSALSTVSECRFRILASRAVSIAGRTQIRVQPKGYDTRCTSTHAPWRNFGPGTEFRETSILSTISECRFRIVVT
ncbi:hypothetical protein Taro_032381 [Colocasia esculenta]|uniref:Uncharacterized protein n=1 Tax=Colocasia esculenta TaxID=4460 RepID=A0A843VZ25_COLES|nr:hypothetical protein [Colocasia esculenta]